MHDDCSTPFQDRSCASLGAAQSAGSHLPDLLEQAALGQEAAEVLLVLVDEAVVHGDGVSAVALPLAVHLAQQQLQLHIVQRVRARSLDAHVAACRRAWLRLQQRRHRLTANTKSGEPSPMQHLRIVTLGLARRGREWPLNDGQIPNPNVVRVAPGTGYRRVKGKRRVTAP